MIWPRTHLIACYIAFLWLDINLSGWLTPPLTLAHPVGEIEDFLAAPLFQSLNYKCADSSKLRAGTPKNRFHFRGTSLGGFLVLEPWLTPSLFYQFLGLTSKWGNGAKDHIAIDSLTFCKALGPEEANRQLRIHWRTWVTEDQIKNLAAIGVETLRIPVADWMFEPYEPFIGCWDGSIDELNRVLDLCWKYNLTALLDLHALRGSQVGCLTFLCCFLFAPQNGLDNSGDTGRYEWVGNASADGVTHYRHWDMRGGTWAGLFDSAAQTFSVNTTAILSSLRVVQKIVSLYREHPAVVGFQPGQSLSPDPSLFPDQSYLRIVNEPAQSIPFEVLAEYYWRSYQLVRRQAPRWLVLLHDSFRLTPEYWGGSFLRGCDHYAVDIHLYHAWDFDHPIDYFVGQACRDHEHLREMELLGVPVVVGEWSLATDNCAMWLNGLNDNVPYFPKVKCDRVQCPEPYFGRGLVPNAPPDPNTKIDPIGDGGPSYVEFGTCPVDRSYPNEIGDVKKFALAQLYSYDLFTHGFFFWNFRTELETRWDYQKVSTLDFCLESPSRYLFFALSFSIRR